MRAFGLVGVSLGLDCRLRCSFTIAALPNATQLLREGRLPVRGDASMHLQGNLSASGNVGINTTILGIRINQSHNFARRQVQLFNNQLGSWQIF